ncbi:MAG: amino acid ABC transporter permease [Proteobacteria bacterium]|nr:amino acid ABC transporter permease [Pseudomonadota bacterium]
MTGADRHLFDAPGPKAIRRMIIGSIIAGVLAVVALAYALVQLTDKGQLAAAKWLPFVTNLDLIKFLLLGLGNTIGAAIVSLGLALVLGIALGVGRLSEAKVVHTPCAAVVELVRGLPVLLNMLFLFLAFPLAFHIDLPAFWTVVLALTLYNGAVIAEIVRAGVLTLPKGQREAAMAMGLSWRQTMALVLLPQAIRIMLPSLISQLVVLIKDSALGFIVGYQELAAQAQSAALLLNNPLQTYMIVGVVYILLNSLLSEASNYIGERQKRTLSKVYASARVAAVDER